MADRRYQTPEERLTEAFEKIPHHRRLYADSVIPTLIAAMREQDHYLMPAHCGGSGRCTVTYAHQDGMLCDCDDAL